MARHYSIFAILIQCLIPVLLAYATLSDKTLKSLPDGGKDFDINNGALLAPILIPRVPDTPGSAKVRKHFLDFFQNELPDWRVDLQNSTSTTPISNGKEVAFSNIIITRDPPWTKSGDVGRLVLVAHYDSLGTLEGFIGATDSAAPCAMLMHVARSIDQALTKKWDAMAATRGDSLEDDDSEQGVQILLLDGEEAFKSWTDTDSVYGARALAEEWETAYFPSMSTYQTPLSSINLFVLLDLLGASNPKIPSYFLTTHWAYKNLASIESRLRELGLFRSSPNHSSKNPRAAAQEPLFLPDANKADASFRAAHIGDDHLPFMERGVEILHLITSPFPSVWHKMTDDGEHLDMDTVEDWTKLITAFAAEWMELDEYMIGNNNNAKRETEHSEL